MKRTLLLFAAAILIPACGGGDDESPQPSVTGTRQILARGGAGTDPAGGTGGAGGYVEFIGDRIAGDVAAYTTGSVNASVDIPDVAPELGSDPRIVSSNLAWEVGDELTQDVNTILGDLGGTATGLWVQAGVTLTIKPNCDTNFDTNNNERVSLAFSDGVWIQGAVRIDFQDSATVGDGLLDRGSDLVLSAGDVVIAASGSLTTSGRSSGTQGGSGGNVEIYASGTFVNSGSLAARGAEDDDGGSAGDVHVEVATYGLFNAGTIDAGGGNGLAGSGGDAGIIQLFSGTDAGVYNTGRILSRGGDGTVDGGWGQSITVMSDTVGAVTSSGVLDTSGGSSSGADGWGGDAGWYNIVAKGGSARFSGTILARGGDGGADGGYGGDSYNFSVWVDATGGAVSPEGLFIGADIDSSGGDGGDGGAAGYTTVEVSSQGYPRPVGITLVGYAVFDVSGGDGTDSGGSVPQISWFTTTPCRVGLAGPYYGGRIYNEVPLVTRGGKGLLGNGGAGGRVTFSSLQSTVNTTPGTGIVNLADIDSSGGDGGNVAGAGGAITFTYDTPDTVGATVGIENSGRLDSHGGSSVAGSGGNGANVILRQYASNALPGAGRSGVINRGVIDARGGDGAFNGGNGGFAQFFGDFWIRNYADLDLSGGSGANAGGSSGDCDVQLVDNHSSVDVDRMEIVNTGNFTLSGGNGGAWGGDAGGTYWYSYGRIVNSGTLNLAGGYGGNEAGGYGYCDMESDTTLTNSGTVNSAGGSAILWGGPAGWIYMASKLTTNSASLVARGGDATVGWGGDADYIEIFSTEDGSRLSGSSMDVRGGTGGTGSGARDWITVDGVKLGGTSASF